MTAVGHRAQRRIREVCETWIKDGASKVRVLVDGKEIGVNHWRRAAVGWPQCGKEAREPRKRTNLEEMRK